MLRKYLLKRRILKECIKNLDVLEFEGRTIVGPTDMTQWWCTVGELVIANDKRYDSDTNRPISLSANWSYV